VLDVGSYYEDSQHDLLFHAQCPSPRRFCAFLELCEVAIVTFG
jgi:hypothetical protein